MPAAVVAVEPVRRARQAEGPTVDPDASEVHAELVVGRVFGHVIQQENDVVGHVEIEVAVKIGIEEGGAGTPHRIVNLCYTGDIGEGAVPVVPEKNIRAEVCHIQISITVVVIISRGAPYSVRLVPQA